MADAPDLGSGGAILRGSSPLPGTLRGWRMIEEKTAVWKAPLLGAQGWPQYLKSNISAVPSGIVEANGAVASDVVREHAATRPPAVHLMDAELIADVELAPGLDENGAARLVREKALQRGPFVFDDRSRDFLLRARRNPGRLKEKGRPQADSARPRSHPRARADRTRRRRSASNACSARCATARRRPSES